MAKGKKKSKQKATEPSGSTSAAKTTDPQAVIRPNSPSPSQVSGTSEAQVVTPSTSVPSQAVSAVRSNVWNTPPRISATTSSTHVTSAPALSGRTAPPGLSAPQASTSPRASAVPAVSASSSTPIATTAWGKQTKGQAKPTPLSTATVSNVTPSGSSGGGSAKTSVTGSSSTASGGAAWGKQTKGQSKPSATTAPSDVTVSASKPTTPTTGSPLISASSTQAAAPRGSAWGKQTKGQADPVASTAETSAEQAISRPPALIGSQDVSAVIEAEQPEVSEHLVPAGMRRPNYGTSGRASKVLANFCGVNVNITNKADPRRGDFLYHQYDVAITPRANQSIALRLIDRLQKGEGPSPIFDARAIEERKNRVAYDGKKILFSPRPLLLRENDSAKFELSVYQPRFNEPLPRMYTVHLKKSAEINPEVLIRLVNREQSSDNDVKQALTALNVISRMQALSDLQKFILEQKIFPRGRSFFSEQGKRVLRGGFEMWRGCTQSIRPGVGRILLNVNTSTALMYCPGSLISLCLNFLGLQPNSPPNHLSYRHGLQDRDRERLSQFLEGMTVVITPASPGRPPQTKRVVGLTRRGASEETFFLREGQKTTIADYYHRANNRPLSYPDVLCIVIESTSDGKLDARIPLERCTVPPGCFFKGEIPPDLQKEFIGFASQSPSDKQMTIRHSLSSQGILGYQTSDYLKAFGVTILPEEFPMLVDARFLNPPSLSYGKGKQSVVKPRNGSWNMVDAKLYYGATINHFLMLIYESERRFSKSDAKAAGDALMKECKNFGINVVDPTVKLAENVLYQNGQGDIMKDIREAGAKRAREKKSLPDLIVFIVPGNAGGRDIYRVVKRFGDVKGGVATQCLDALKCKRAKQQYWANVCLKINGKLGGINTVLDRSSAAGLYDQRSPVIIMGADVTHPAPGANMKNMPSHASVVSSVDSDCVRYAAKLEVQERQEMIVGLEKMATELIKEHIRHKTQVENKSEAQASPKRLIFYRDGVSEGEYIQVLQREFPQLQKACKACNISPAITFIIVGKRHHARFFPKDEKDKDNTGNCPAGMVVERDITHPYEFDFYLQSHAGLIKESTVRPAHYVVLHDENKFQADAIQSLSYALCHVFARATRSVSLPAPVYYAHLVCDRARNHYDPSQPIDHQSKNVIEQYRKAFEPSHVKQFQRMYFL